MADVSAPPKRFLDDLIGLFKSRGALATIISVGAAFGAWLGIDVSPKELMQPALKSIDFYQVGNNQRDADALIERIKMLAKQNAQHPLIQELRSLAKSGSMPFGGLSYTVDLRLNDLAPKEFRGWVCRDSHLNGTYLQFAAPSPPQLVTIAIEGSNRCNFQKLDEVQLHSEIWRGLGLPTVRPTTDWKFDVFLQRPDEPAATPVADEGAVRRAALDPT
jgi:hypothetical protein